MLASKVVSIPDIEMQRKIASSIRPLYDALIENNRRRIALLEQAARLLYEEWFVRFRFPGHEHTNSSMACLGWRNKSSEL